MVAHNAVDNRIAKVTMKNAIKRELPNLAEACKLLMNINGPASADHKILEGKIYRQLVTNDITYYGSRKLSVDSLEVPGRLVVVFVP